MPATASAREAYVANRESSSVSVLDLASNQVVEDPIELPFRPNDVAITPDGERAYVAGPLPGGDNSEVSVIDTETDQLIGDPILIGPGARAIAITPDGARVYVANEAEDAVSVIDTATGSMVGDPIEVGRQPVGIAITPDGESVYVAVLGNRSLTEIETASNTVVETFIDFSGRTPFGLATAPDGGRVYVASVETDKVRALDPEFNRLAATPYPVGNAPEAIAVAPDGRSAFVANNNSDDVSMIDLLDGTVSAPIPAGEEPNGVAITANGERAYVVNRFSDDVSVIDTAANQTIGDAIDVGSRPEGIAITPNQPPVAELSAEPLAVTTGEPVSFDASGSTDDEGIETYSFDYGDGDQGVGASETRTHAYTEPGTYTATVTVDDGEDCPGFVFTGQTASCNGPSEVTSEEVEIVVTDPVVPPEPGEFTLGFGLERPLDSLNRVDGTVTCRGADCEASGEGVLVVRRGEQTRRFGLDGFSAVDLDADRPDGIALQISPVARKAARRALRSNGRVRVRTRVEASDALGRERAAVRAGLLSP